MSNEDRIHAVEKFMKGEFPLEVRPMPVAKRLWPSMIALTDAADTHRPFGFSTSQYFPYDERWSFFYCAEIIVELTEALDDEQFDAWLRYVRAHVNTHIVLDTTSESEVESAIYTVMPEARDLVGRVHNLLFAGAM